MRVDRSRIRAIHAYEGGDYGFIGLTLSLGVHQFTVFGLSARSDYLIEAWHGGLLARGSDDEAEVLGWFEHQFLTEELPKLSAHQRIAMVRDGLLIPEVPHLGKAV